jgi:hypothetical protein
MAGHVFHPRSSDLVARWMLGASMGNAIAHGCRRTDQAVIAELFDAHNKLVQEQDFPEAWPIVQLMDETFRLSDTDETGAPVYRESGAFAAGVKGPGK